MSFIFKIEDQNISKVLLVSTDKFQDKRGEIFTTYDKEISKRLMKYGVPKFTHTKIVIANKNSLRGMHTDKNTWKMVTLIKGKIQQIILDLRENSKVYGKYSEYNWTEGNEQNLLVIPPMVGNGFLAIEDSIYLYHLAYTGEYTDADKQITVSWKDERFKIPWLIKNPQISKRDKECTK